MNRAGTLQSSKDWRSLEFASDLHLCAEAPRTYVAFERWLTQTQADALFVLGDLFEVWIGDDTADEPFHRQCLGLLAQASEQRPIYFICGNRDFLLGPAALAMGGLTALDDPCRLEVFGQSLLLSHGDALCTSDTRYQAFRTMVRDARWQQHFLSRPVVERAAVAQRIRSESQGRKAAQPDLSQWPDVDADEARRWLSETQTRTLIHGHTHRPGVVDLGEGMERRVLTDWDFDGMPQRGHVLRLDAQGWANGTPPIPP